MNVLFRHLIASMAVLAVLALAPAAGASPSDVLRACLNEGSLDGFSDADKRGALNQLAADQDEYSDCRSVIGASIGGSKKVTATASRNTPSGQAQTKKARRARKATEARRQRQVREVRRIRARQVREQKLGPRAVDPRDPGVFKAAATANGMPPSVLFAVIALGLLSLTGSALALLRRNPRFAGALRRVSLPRFRR